MGYYLGSYLGSYSYLGAFSLLRPIRRFWYWEVESEPDRFCYFDFGGVDITSLAY